MNEFTETKIKKLIPAARYEGQVYTQDVVVELETGEEITLFDPDMTQFSKKDIGKSKKLRIDIFYSEIQSEKPQLIKEKEKK